MPDFGKNEQEFLQRYIKGVYYFRTSDPTIKFNQNPSNYKRLFDDICKLLNIPEESVIVDATGYFFDYKGFKASYRSLSIFFTNNAKKGIESSALLTLYAYATRRQLSREQISEAIQYDGFLVRVSQAERKKLVDTFFRKSQSFGGEIEEAEYDGKHGYLASYLESQIRKLSELCPNPFMCINPEEIHMLLEHKKGGSDMSIATLNTLYSLLEQEMITRHEWLERNNEFFLAPRHDFFPKDQKTPLQENTAFAFMLMMILATTTLCLFIMDKLSPTLLVGLLVAIIASIGLFFVLMWQSKKSNSLIYSRGKDWDWFNKEYSSEALSVATSIHILLVYDKTDYDTALDVQRVREQFSVAHVIEYNVSSAQEAVGLKETLERQSIDGLYFFLTHNVNNYGLSVIKEWSDLRKDIPVVYVDTIGVNLDYGRIDPDKDEGIGLWSLLSQASNRAAFFKTQVDALKYVVKMLLGVLIVSLVSVLVSSGVQRKDIGTQDQILYQAQWLNSYQLFNTLRTLRDTFIRNYGESISSTNVDFSIFGLGDTLETNPVIQELRQFSTTEEDNEGTLTAFPHPSNTLASTALQESNSPFNHNAVFVRRKSIADTLEGGYFRDTIIHEPNRKLIFTDAKPESRSSLNGLICVSDRELTICAEFVRAEEFAKKALSNDNLETTVLLLEKSLIAVKNRLGSKYSFKLFPDPNDQYYKELFFGE